MTGPKIIRTMEQGAGAYWNSPIARKEVQAALDDYTKLFVELRTQVTKLEFAVSFLCERAGVTPEEVAEFMRRTLDAAAKAAEVQ